MLGVDRFQIVVEMFVDWCNDLESVVVYLKFLKMCVENTNDNYK